ncbi:MAG TPA: SMC-Scp complex subunit ScpB [Chloroflexota bacterium]|nr:SMC-Scp complex subunit ScpB [Chloroflexota bacterium]
MTDVVQRRDAADPPTPEEARHLEHLAGAQPATAGRGAGQDTRDPQGTARDVDTGAPAQPHGPQSPERAAPGQPRDTHPRETIAFQPEHPIELQELSLAAQIEAILFVAERPVTVVELAKLLRVPPDTVEDAVSSLAGGTAARGLSLQRHGDALQLVTHPKAAPAVQRFLGLELSAKLSPAALETLAIIAYRQPVTRAQIETLRGVNSDHALANLVARGLVAEVGRLNAVGRPILYGTTFEFLQAFGLRTLDDLPQAGLGTEE